MTTFATEPDVIEKVEPTKPSLDVITDQTSLIAALRFLLATTTAAKKTYGLQITQAVRLDAGDRGLTLSRFDYEATARQTISGTGTGTALVNVTDLRDLIIGMTKGCAVVLKAEVDELLVIGDEVTYKMPTYALDDYLELPAIGEHHVAVFTATTVARFTDVAIAAGKDDTLPVLTGILFQTDGVGTLRAAATDRYRLAVLDTCATTTSVKLLIPASTVKAVAAQFKGEYVTLSHNGKDPAECLVTFAASGRSVTTRVIDGTFPDYNRLLPSSGFTGSLTVDSKAFVKAVNQVAKVAARTSPITLVVTEDVELQAGSQGSMTATKTLPATTEGLHPTVAYNPDYLLDGIKAAGGDSFAIHFVGVDDFEASRKPAILAAVGDTAFRYLLMPVRLNG